MTKIDSQVKAQYDHDRLKSESAGYDDDRLTRESTV